MRMGLIVAAVIVVVGSAVAWIGMGAQTLALQQDTIRCEAAATAAMSPAAGLSAREAEQKITAACSAPLATGEAISAGIRSLGRMPTPRSTQPS